MVLEAAIGNEGNKTKNSAIFSGANISTKRGYFDSELGNSADIEKHRLLYTGSVNQSADAQEETAAPNFNN